MLGDVARIRLGRLPHHVWEALAGHRQRGLQLLQSARVIGVIDADRLRVNHVWPGCKQTLTGEGFVISVSVLLQPWHAASLLLGLQQPGCTHPMLAMAAEDRIDRDSCSAFRAIAPQPGRHHLPLKELPLLQFAGPRGGGKVSVEADRHDQPPDGHR